MSQASYRTALPRCVPWVTTTGTSRPDRVGVARHTQSCPASGGEAGSAGRRLGRDRLVDRRGLRRRAGGAGVDLPVAAAGDIGWLAADSVGRVGVERAAVIGDQVGAGPDRLVDRAVADVLVQHTLDR